ncbi:hypothetical protein BSKO_11046 [Bryopsis sp. KO-2023]|nr:hypothetical protein BSKO_11046 [Bryopsis sp. KO-2023]
MSEGPTVAVPFSSTFHSASGKLIFAAKTALDVDVERLDLTPRVRTLGKFEQSKGENGCEKEKLITSSVGFPCTDDRLRKRISLEERSAIEESNQKPDCLPLRNYDRAPLDIMSFSFSLSHAPTCAAPRRAPRVASRIVCRAQNYKQQNEKAVNRRGVLLGSGLAMGAVAAFPALAGKPPVPKAYYEFVDKLTTQLIETIDLEASGASEIEVRRKADDAKNLVREFVLSWRGDIRVSKEASYKEIAEALTELGNFYMKNGQRMKLPSDLSAEIRGHLEAAKAAAVAPVA